MARVVRCRVPQKYVFESLPRRAFTGYRVGRPAWRNAQLCSELEMLLARYGVRLCSAPPGVALPALRGLSWRPELARDLPVSGCLMNRSGVVQKQASPIFPQS